MHPKKIVFKHNSWDGDNNPLTPAILSDFESYLMDKQRLYMKMEGGEYLGIPLFTLTSSTRSNLELQFFKL